MVNAGLTLALDAASTLGTIALLRDGVSVAERTLEMRSRTDERYFPAVLDALREVGATPRDLARVVCGAGPGSFTALRVVGAIAKGLCEGGGIPLFGVPSLALIVAANESTRSGGRWLATLDAMRDDRYLALVTSGRDGAIAAVESLGLVAASEVASRALALDATPIGPDEAQTAEPHARGVERCWDLVLAPGPVEVASWEPVYGRLAEAQVKWEATHGRPLVADRYDA